MKKLFLLCFTLLIIIPLFARAETKNENDIVIESITRGLTSDISIEKSKPIIDGSNIKLNLDFSEKGNFINYILVIKNNSKNDFMLNKEKINFNTNYISYIIEPIDKNDTIKSSESKEFVLTVKYIKEIDNENFENGVFNDNKSLSFDLIGVENNIPNPDTGINNPLFRIVKIIFQIRIQVLIIRYLE